MYMIQFALLTPSRLIEKQTLLILNFGHWMDVNNQLEAQKLLDLQPFLCEALSCRQN